MVLTSVAVPRAHALRLLPQAALRRQMAEQTAQAGRRLDTGTGVVESAFSHRLVDIDLRAPGEEVARLVQRDDPPPMAGVPPEVTGDCSVGVDDHGNPFTCCDTGDPDKGQVCFPPSSAPASRPFGGGSPAPHASPSGQPSPFSPGQPQPGLPPDLSAACPDRFNPLTGLCCRPDQVFDPVLQCTCPPGQVESMGMCQDLPAPPQPGDYPVPSPDQNQALA